MNFEDIFENFINNIRQDFSEDELCKFVYDIEVIECAKSIKDCVKKFKNLNSYEKQIASILLSKKLLEEGK